MPDQNRYETTILLEQAIDGNKAAVDKLLPLVYEELRKLAGGYLKCERSDHTLMPTELVHKAYERLIDCNQVSWQGRTHFLAMGAKTMRRILIDHARGRRAKKRGGSQPRVALSGIAEGDKGYWWLDFTESMEELKQLKPRHYEVLTHRFYAGLNVRETAMVLGLATRTVERDTRAAIAWLRSRLEE